MSFELKLAKSVARCAAVAVVAVGASACSSVPEWANPTAWIGGDDQVATQASTAPAPDLASIPDKPATPSTADERKQVADSLAADRSDAQYSADALRGGTEPSAAPPPDAPPPQTETLATAAPAATVSAPPASSEPKTAEQTKGEQKTADVQQPQAASPATSAEPAPETDKRSADAMPAAAPAQPAITAQVANVTPAGTDTAVAAPTTPDEQLGFEASKAPALDANVARFVPKQLLDRYQQTSGGASAAVPAAEPKADSQQSSSIGPSTDNRMARLATPSAQPRATMLSPASYTPGQTQPQAVVFFPRDDAALNASSKAQIRTAAEAYRAGGTGYVRVVGHSSSRTANMSLARHLEVVFEHSQAFATAVAHELVRDGVPADKVLIEAVGDSQPVYYESMPQGEAGNRRAEIFL